MPHKSLEDRRAYARRRHHRQVAKVMGSIEKLKAVPCMDCGNRFPPECMDFDHRDPAEKLFSVADKIGALGLEKLLQEIKKCDTVCSDCHRIRTKKQNEIRKSREFDDA